MVISTPSGNIALQPDGGTVGQNIARLVSRWRSHHQQHSCRLVSHMLQKSRRDELPPHLTTQTAALSINQTIRTIKCFTNLWGLFHMSVCIKARRKTWGRRSSFKITCEAFRRTFCASRSVQNRQISMITLQHPRCSRSWPLSTSYKLTVKLNLGCSPSSYSSKEDRAFQDGSCGMS